MSIPLFLAMTDQEIRQTPSLPEKTAWMSCHFLAGGTGISHLPTDLPHGSMLILDDRIPFRGHDPALICAHLKEILWKFRCSHMLLDFERPPTAVTLQFARQLSAQLPCPVGVPKDYAKDLPCPVFLPPVPPHLALETYLAPWTGREIWLEAALDGSAAAITDKGCRFSPVPFPVPGEPMHRCAELHCHYHTAVSSDEIVFSFFRTRQDLADLQTHAKEYGVTLTIGLYQELEASP